MDRRTFLIRSAKLATGGLALSLLPGLAQAVEMADKAVQAASNGTLRFDHELYHRFANPIPSITLSYDGGGMATWSKSKSCAVNCV